MPGPWNGWRRRVATWPRGSTSVDRCRRTSSGAACWMPATPDCQHTGHSGIQAPDFLSDCVALRGEQVPGPPFVGNLMASRGANGHVAGVVVQRVVLVGQLLGSVLAGDGADQDRQQPA